MQGSNRPRTLYHFTSRASWHFIQREGIDRGDAPTSAREALNHPNLTSNPDPDAQKWSSAPGLEDDPRLVRKNAVRIAVHVPTTDRRLISWRDFAKLHKMPRRDYDEFNATGGYQADHWWIYRGTVRPSWFTEAEFFDGGQITPIEAVMLASALRSSSHDEMLARMGTFRQGRFTCISKVARPRFLSQRRRRA